jgi:protein-S-isoprenylcysteine O-methyltransferase Ste14
MSRQQTAQARLVFERQWLHAALLAVLLLGLAWVSSMEKVQAGHLWGIPSIEWLWLAVASAVLHQVYVWFCWRTELYCGLISRMLNSRGFTAYAVLFSVLGIARVAAVFCLAIANRDTLPVNLVVLRAVAVVVLIPAIYLFYSVQRYFGFKRAFGIDHFEPGYRSLPLVRQGIFRYTRNGMYTFGFMLLWAPALWYASAAALCAALFNHLYIWVHYFATELPDMRRIYRSSTNAHAN